jgi:hypothetical protein
MFQSVKKSTNSSSLILNLLTKDNWCLMQRDQFDSILLLIICMIGLLVSLTIAFNIKWKFSIGMRIENLRFLNLKGNHTSLNSRFVNFHKWWKPFQFNRIILCSNWYDTNFEKFRWFRNILNIFDWIKWNYKDWKRNFVFLMYHLRKTLAWFKFIIYYITFLSLYNFKWILVMKCSKKYF